MHAPAWVIVVTLLAKIIGDLAPAATPQPAPQHHIRHVAAHIKK